MDFGPLTKILGLRIDCDHKNGTLKIFQGPYIDLILDCFRMTDCHPVVTPMALNVKLQFPEELVLHDE